MADNATKSYGERLVFMMTLVVLSAFLQGIRAVVICILSVAAAMAADALCCLIRKIRWEPKDTAVIFWGLSTGMLMPVSASFWAVILSAVLCIIVGKHFFGASDSIVFCPPAISAAFMIICYPAQMLYFPKFGEIYPIFGEYDGILTRSSEYSLELGYTPAENIWDTLLGFAAGPIGTVYGIVIIVCGICLAVRKKNSPAAMVSCLATVGVLAFFFPRANYEAWNSVFYELSSGYLLFGTVFLCAEPYCMPQKTSARVVYGVVLGYVTMMFRIFGKTEGGFLFALLIVSALSDSFDRLVENVEYWRKTYFASFEKNKTRVQRGEVKLSDTQEIVIPKKFRYNTPPIDGEIKKHSKRRRRNRREDYDGKQ